MCIIPTGETFCRTIIDNALIEPVPRHAGLQVDLKKCDFDVTKTRYLGLITDI